MTVNNETTRNDYTLNGVATNFDYTFKIFEASDLEVKKLGLDGIETELVLNTDYTVSGAGTDAGGEIVLTDPGTDGESLVIRRNIPRTQTVSFKNQGAFYPERHEDAYDRLVMLLQQLTEETTRSIQLPVTFTGTAELDALVDGYCVGLVANGDGSYRVTMVANSGASQVADLANTTTASKGAGMVGFNYSLAYAANTVGDAVKDVMDRVTVIEAMAAGQCRFIYTNSTTCTLQRWNGKYLMINGVWQVIPSAGVTLAATGLTPSTLYYVYAYMNGTTMTLEASTTSHSTNSVTGVETKSNDSSKTLVGMVYPITGPAFADSTTQRLVASWFNRRLRKVQGAISTNRTCTTTGSWPELNSEARAYFLSWGDSAHAGSTATFGFTAASSYSGLLGLGIDGASPAVYSGTSTATTNNLSFGGTIDPIAEGFRYGTFVAQVSSAGTLTVVSGATWTIGLWI